MNLQKYIVNVEQLEKQKYALECTIRKIDSKISRLGAPIEVRRGHNPVSEEDTKLNYVQIIILLAATGLLFLGLYAVSLAPQFFLSCFLFLILPEGLVILYIIASVKGNRESYFENEQKLDAEYSAARKSASVQIEQEKQMAVYYQDARNCLHNTYSKTCSMLQYLYSYNIIYEKYRYDLVAICMFAEYFKSGRCVSFQGHEGAYNIYEQEIRLGIIIEKLDEIIERLDRIEQNQYGLYQALNEISRRQDRILTNLESISKRQERQLENAEYMRYNLEVIRTQNDIAMVYGMKYQ